MEITQQIQETFLAAKGKADAEGHGGTAYVHGLRAVLALPEVRQAIHQEELARDRSEPGMVSLVTALMARDASSPRATLLTMEELERLDPATKITMWRDLPLDGWQVRVL